LNYKWKIIALLFIAFCLSSCDKEESNIEYTKQIEEYRANVIDFFLNSQDSPLVDMMEKSEPIYYAPKEKYRVEAYLEQFDNQDTLEMLTTQSDVRKMVRYGELQFKLDDQKYTLNAYINVEHPESFFVPFHDKTNGKETYEAGRYIDIERTDKTKYILDFNLAYNPYCYYNPKYSCPIVPEENILNTKIEAGEKADNEKH